MLGRIFSTEVTRARHRLRQAGMAHQVSLRESTRPLPSSDTSSARVSEGAPTDLREAQGLRGWLDVIGNLQSATPCRSAARLNNMTTNVTHNMRDQRRR